MSGRKLRFVFLAFAPLAALNTFAVPAHAAATVTVVNLDRPNEGFNDPTPATPVGGNPGTTVGRQRLIAFQFAANIWASTIDSTVPITIQASFDPLFCTSTSGALGAAGTIQILADFPGAPFANTWYNSALANKLAGEDLIPGPPGSFADDIAAHFNSELGKPGCLEGGGWYYGLDNNHGPLFDLVAVLLHELSHGLGFQEFADLTNGEQILDMTDIYARNLLDTSTGKTWDQMTDAERAASAINPRMVVWNGANVTAEAPGVLMPGTPLLTVNSPAAIAGTYMVGTASFGPPLSSPGITGDVVLVSDGAGASATDACEPIVNDVSGKIALVDRGTCAFVVKVKNAQDAGALAVLVADNVPGSPPAGLGGSDPTITIPSVRITQADGNTIKANLPGVNATLSLDLTRLSGADAAGRVLVYSPDPLELGSSISHWDTIASPNLLMEPFLNDDLTHSVSPPEDLTLPLFRDIGWSPEFPVDQCPVSNTDPSVVIQGCDSEVPNILFASGCTLSDMIDLCASSSKNHGMFTSCVSAVVAELNRRGALTGAQKSSLQGCVAKSSLP